jgi:hypothetical protein
MSHQPPRQVNGIVIPGRYMVDVIQHRSGIVVSVKTFRPLLIFPWTASIWRQFPFAAAIATVAFKGRDAAQRGHRQLVELLRGLDHADMHELFGAVEAFAKANGDIVKSYRVYPGHAVEGKVKMKISK